MENETYQTFLKDNPHFGTLRVQVYMANQAIPIQGVKVLVQKEINNQTLTIYEGVTDQSGLINDIKLPAPIIIDQDNPNYVTYTLIVDHPSYKGQTSFTIPIYDNQKMIQYVNLIPSYQGDINE